MITFQCIFAMGWNSAKKSKSLSILRGGTMGHIHPVWVLAAIHPRWGNRYQLLLKLGTLLAKIAAGPEEDCRKYQNSNAPA